MTKCELDNDADCYSVSEELCVRSSWEYENFTESLRGKGASIALPTGETTAKAFAMHV